MILNATGTGLFFKTMLYLANQTTDQNQNTMQDFYNSPMGSDMDPNQPRCYGLFGCFPISSPWTTENRPVSYYPQSPSKIQATFSLYTKYKRRFPVELDLNKPNDVKEMDINPNGNIYLIAHGYIDSGNRPWIEEMKNALLDQDTQGRSSVIVVDWGRGSIPPYTQAVANIRLVGVITAHIIHMVYEQLKMKNLDNVHMLGHSLGAHLSGYTGYALQKEFGLKMGRITGMDPAEPLFTDSDPIVRLDRNDASFVDVIHTDTVPITQGGLGMPKAIGHVDFYPNGGRNNPGCDAPVDYYINQEEGSFFWGVQQFLSCNHVRSHQYMIESIKTSCPFLAVTCASYEDFLEGKCFNCTGGAGNNCLNFGFHSQQSYNQLQGSGSVSSGQPIKAYLKTNSRSPYCRSHYKVSAFISSSVESAGNGGEVGILSVNVQSDRDRDREFDERERGFQIIRDRYEREHVYKTQASNEMRFSDKAMPFEPGFEYSSVMAGEDVERLSYVSLNWVYKTSPWNILTWRITTPRVHVEHIIIESLEHRTKLRLCPMYGYPVVSGTPSVFRHEYCNDVSY